MDIVSKTMSRVIKQDLGLGAFKWQTGQHLTIALKENGGKNQDTCCCRTVKNIKKEILFTDEKMFTIEETFNKQNDRVYAWSSKEARELVPRIERASVIGGECPLTESLL